VHRVTQRQGFLVSAIVHLVILMSLAGHTPTPVPVPEPPPEAPPEVRERIFLPPPAVLRQVLPPPPPVPRRPDAAKDRISVGPPSRERAKGPMLLRREDDLTAVPKGRPDARPSVEPPATAAMRPAQEPAREGLPSPEPGTGGLRLPRFGSGSLPRGSEGGPAASAGARGPSIASSLRNLDRMLQDGGPSGLPTGTGQQMGPLFFDPQGADFTHWINHFKNEVYRNWIVPQAALLGYRGHVDIEFTVERDGRISKIQVLKPSGTPALDRAAHNALTGSRFLSLPDDFGPARVTMQATFFYNEAPQGS
jgi:TonB family protein